MDLSRRETLVLGGALAATAAAEAPVPTIAGIGESLNHAAQRSGRRFGSALGIGRPGRPSAFTDPQYRRIVSSECELIVPENELKWQWIRHSPTGFDFRGGDRLLAWANSQGLAMRGHNLVWHHPKWWPDWVTNYDFGPHPAAEAARMLREHIETVCRHYPTIRSWDVVNEAVDAGTGAMRETVFSKAMGSADAVLDLAFRTAREAASHAQLVYNDYMSWEPGNEAHRAGVLRLLERFRKNGTPVDALGVQSHIGSGNNPGDPSVFGPHDERAWRHFLDEVTGMGYQLLITEFDVNDRGIQGDIAARDREVAAYARAYLNLMLSYRQLGDVLCWGMMDTYSWLQERPPRADGLPERCTPYNSDYRPKPLRAAIEASFRRAAPHRG
jgi:endo-1,4-beta-xylanase